MIKAPGKFEGSIFTSPWFSWCCLFYLAACLLALKTFPGWAQKISWFNPVAYFIRVILKGSGLDDIRNYLLIILVLVAIIKWVRYFQLQENGEPIAAAP